MAVFLPEAIEAAPALAEGVEAEAGPILKGGEGLMERLFGYADKATSNVNLATQKVTNLRQSLKGFREAALGPSERQPDPDPDPEADPVEDQLPVADQPVNEEPITQEILEDQPVQQETFENQIGDQPVSGQGQVEEILEDQVAQQLPEQQSEDHPVFDNEEPIPDQTALERTVLAHVKRIHALEGEVDVLRSAMARRYRSTIGGLVQHPYFADFN